MNERKKSDIQIVNMKNLSKFANKKKCFDAGAGS